MSPEQLLGEPVDERTDIYSLGVTLFELVTGQRPYAGDTPLLLRHTALTAPMRTARDVDPLLAPAVSDVIARAVARDPAERFQTAGELESELKRVLADMTSSGSAASFQSPADLVGSWRLARFAAWLLAAAGALAAVVIPFVQWKGSGDGGVAARPVIAVLPLENVSGDPSKAYLGVGIADALTTSLARLSSISVVSRSTVLEAGPPTRSLEEIARDLGATMLVRGSIQQAGDRSRISATLLTPEGRVLWSGDTQATLAELFAMENQLAESLLTALRITISSAERQRFARAPTQDPEALKANWQGLAHMDRPDDADYEAAVAHFKSATARDLQFSLAFAALGETYRRRSVMTNNGPLMEEAVKAVSEALRLDPEQPEVRLSLAGVYRSTGRNSAAIEEVNRVLAEQPDNDNAHRLLGELLASSGRQQQALEELRRAVSLRPQYWRHQQALGLFLYQNGRIREAVDVFTRLTELKPNDATPVYQLGAMYLALGDRARARQNFERSLQLQPNASSFTNLGTIAYVEGRYADAVHAYEEAISVAPSVALYRRNLGDAYQKLNRMDDARAAYQKAIDLAEEALTVNPSDSTTISQLAVYYAKAGARVEAERNALRAMRMNPVNPEVLYRRAVVLALIGEPDAAVRQLSEAIEKGYALNRALEDDDLASLKTLPAFQRLAEKVKSR